MVKIVVVVGTNRAGCKSLVVANALVERYAAMEGVEVSIADLATLPSGLLSPTSYAEKPEAFQPFVDQVLEADGLHVVVPEYNGSFPGVLKLFIDHLPFPEAFEGRKVCYTGISAGMWGGLRSVEHLQGVFGYRNAHQYPERVFIPRVFKNLDEDGWPKEELTRELADQQVSGFVAFCGALSA